MPSQLTFDATESFRKKLLLKNLPPYREALQGDDKPGTDEFRVKDLSVNNPGSVESIGNIQEEKLYVKNKYGPEYSTVPVEFTYIQPDQFIKTNNKEKNMWRF